MTEFHDWDDIRAELDDGDGDALNAERVLTEQVQDGRATRCAALTVGFPCGGVAPHSAP